MSGKKGFSGLDNLSSDIDEIIKEHDKKQQENTEEKKDNFSNSDTNEITDNVKKTNTNSANSGNTSKVTSENSNKGSLSWIWWPIAIGVFFWILIQSSSNSSSGRKSSMNDTAEKTYSQNIQSNNYSKTTSEDYYESKPDAYL